MCEKERERERERQGESEEGEREGIKKREKSYMENIRQTI